jgi:hypothetical protein
LTLECSFARRPRAQGIDYYTIRPIPVVKLSQKLILTMGENLALLTYKAHGGGAMIDNRTQVFDVVMKNARTIEACLDRLAMMGAHRELKMIAGVAKGQALQVS